MGSKAMTEKPQTIRQFLKLAAKIEAELRKDKEASKQSVEHAQALEKDAHDGKLRMAQVEQAAHRLVGEFKGSVDRQHRLADFYYELQVGMHAIVDKYNLDQDTPLDELNFKDSPADESPKGK